MTYRPYGPVQGENMKTEILRFRVTPEMKGKLKDAAKRSRKTLTGWALSALNATAEGRPIYAPEDVAALNEAVEQFRKAAINLNQLVKYLHQYDAGTRATLDLPEPRQWVAALADIEETATTVRRRLGIR